MIVVGRKMWAIFFGLVPMHKRCGDWYGHGSKISTKYLLKMTSYMEIWSKGKVPNVKDGGQ